MKTNSARVFALAMLNSSLDDAEIIPYLNALKSAGYEGIALHPRDGLRVPFDSRVFWEKMDHIFSLCRERDLEIWHYDEFPYPSGHFGGMLPIDEPDCLARGLKFEEIELTPNRDGAIEIGSQPLLALLRFRENANGEIFDVRDVTADTGSLFDTWTWREHHNLFYTGTLNVHEEKHERAFMHRYVRAFISNSPLEADEKLLAIKIIEAAGSVPGAGRPDVARTDVTDRFLQRSYSKLAELSQKHNLQSTPVFQDEVTFGAANPWNEEIKSRLQKVWGDELFTKLIALHAPRVENWEQTRWEFRSACQDAFEENWFVRVRDFCHANNLQMTGHLAGEESLYGHCQLLGNAFKNLRHFDVPGYDIISSTISNDINRGQQIGIKVVQSTAWLEGRKPTMVEAFGANGIHSDLQRQRNVLAWLGAHDFLKVFDHSTYLSAHSLRKYEAPPVSTRFNPLFVGRADLWNWHNWFCDLMQEFSFHPKTLILFPVESLARYSTEEIELWRGEVSFLETWFHYACAASLDAIFLPSHFLKDVQMQEDGFHLQGHVFENFVVPPLSSLHADMLAGVLPLQNHKGFAWCCGREKSVTVFGANAGAQIHSISAPRVFTCDENELLEKKAAFFDDILQSPLREIQSDATLMKTLRRNADGKEIIVLINTHDAPLEVRCETSPGALSPQPPNNFSGFPFCGGKLKMQPREVLVFDATPTTPGVLPAPNEREEITPEWMRFRFCTPNFQHLQTGTMRLEKCDEISFAPATTGENWKLEHADFSPMRKLQAEFSIALQEPILDLSILYDAESAPPIFRVFWDDEKLQPRHAEILDQNNTLFPIPAELLTAGKHRLRFESTIENSNEGFLERPILQGDFLVSGENQLRAMPRENQNWNCESWPQLGAPQGFGPHEYEFDFQLTAEQAAQKWNIHLPDCIGVAQVWIGENEIGQSSWAPRVLPTCGLRAGRNVLRVRLHGSWNNLLSRLNTLENGLRGVVKLASL
jgi:hypothetical protein